MRPRGLAVKYMRAIIVTVVLTNQRGWHSLAYNTITQVVNEREINKFFLE